MSRASGLVSLKIAADILGCGTSTLRTWDNEGSLKAVRTPGGQRRYRIEDLERVQREGLAPMLQGVLAKFLASCIEDVTLCHGSAVASHDARIAFADHPTIYGIRVGSLCRTLTKAEYDCLRRAGATEVLPADLNK